MPQFADVQKHNDSLVRKAIGGSLFGGAFESANLLTSLTSGANSELIDIIGGGYSDFGLMTTDGWTISQNEERTEIRSAFRRSVTRTDVSSRTETLACTLQETKRTTIALLNQVDPSELVPNATTGELFIERAEVPKRQYYRLLALAMDEYDGEFYMGRYWPKVEITEVADRAVSSDSDSGYTYGFTFTSLVDAAAGYASADIYGGPGFKNALEEMGF